MEERNAEVRAVVKGDLQPGIWQVLSKSESGKLPVRENAAIRVEVTIGGDTMRP